jgi:hypothetical protein
MEREPREYNRKRPILERQRRDIALLPSEVGKPKLLRVLRTARKHRRCHVNPGDMLHAWREGACDHAAAAGDVEHSVGRFNGLPLIRS